MTGKNPGEHGIFGFTDRKAGTYELCFPNYSSLKADPLWDELSREGRRCCVINVPSTYPARELNGVLVSGFVAPNLEKATFPREAYDYLEKMGYRIDVDASKGRQSLDLLLEDLHDTLEKRREAMLHFWSLELWDLFVCVFTGTDRLHHFMWRHYAEGDPVYANEFLRYYERVDEIIGEFVEMLDENVAIFMMSDHGFCTLKKQVYLNYKLNKEGLLNYNTDEPMALRDIAPERTKAYCMDPGRLYVNLKGREPGGTVDPGAEYEDTLKMLKDLMGGLTDDDGAPIVESVFRGSDIYSGPFVDKGPDLIVHPRAGYDLKGSLNMNVLTDIGHLSGMHTYDDAMLYASEACDDAEVSSIREVASLIRRTVS
jgi:predicted AlkP superfamily phosphohydrolase/phosphomutase